MQSLNIEVSIKRQVPDVNIKYIVIQIWFNEVSSHVILFKITIYDGPMFIKMRFF